TDEAHVGDQLELQPQAPLLSLPPRLGQARRPVGGALEVDVAPAAGTARGDLQPGSFGVEVPDRQARLLLDDLGADRDPEHEVGPLAARLQPTGARLPVPRAPDPLAGVLGEVCQRAVGEQEDRSSASAVAAVGTASGRERLVPERSRAGAAAPTSNGDGGGVYESATKKP